MHYIAHGMHPVEVQEEEEEFHKFLPAHKIKADHLCQLWQSCSDLYQLQTVFDIAENPQMTRLSKKWPHGIRHGIKNAKQLAAQYDIS